MSPLHPPLFIWPTTESIQGHLTNWTFTIQTSSCTQVWILDNSQHVHITFTRERLVDKGREKVLHCNGALSTWPDFNMEHITFTEPSMCIGPVICRPHSHIQIFRGNRDHYSHYKWTEAKKINKNNPCESWRALLKLVKWALHFGSKGKIESIYLWSMTFFKTVHCHPFLFGGCRAMNQSCSLWVAEEFTACHRYLLYHPTYGIRSQQLIGFSHSHAHHPWSKPWRNRSIKQQQRI